MKPYLYNASNDFLWRVMCGMMLRYDMCTLRNDMFITSFVYLSLLGGQDCFGRPIASAPDAWFDVVERHSNDGNKTLQYVFLTFDSTPN